MMKNIKHKNSAASIAFLLTAILLLATGCAGEKTSNTQPDGSVSVTGTSISTTTTARTTGLSDSTTVRTTTPTNAKGLPDGFVYVSDTVPDAILEIRYYSTYNFIGARVDDYLAPVAILTEEAANALKSACDDLRAKGYAIKVFDAYRPQGAVDHFMRWAADTNDVLTKKYFYPDIDKARIIPDGYVAERSGHTRGSTVDLTLVDMLTGKELDMGTPFDFFGPPSHHGSSLITKEQANNRLILKNAMEKAGFKPYDEEWWHYTLIDEPYPDTYFDFPVQG